MEIRLAHPNEINAIMAIIDGAKAHLAQSGIDQWQDGYPDSSHIFDDVLDGRGYVGLVDGQVVAYAVMAAGHEEAFDAIYDGKWQHDNHHYVTFHRVAVSPEHQGQGLAQTFLQGLIEGYDGHDFRCDTHEKNLGMQAVLKKLGFVYCGKVPVAGERLAYQKIKHSSEKALYQEISEDDRWMLGAAD